MAYDYSNSKAPPGQVSPLNASDTSSFQRLEPLITPEQLKQRWLFGIPMVSAIKNPITGERAKLTDDTIKDMIVGAVSDAEVETSTTIFPTQINEKYEFDRNEYLSFGYFRTRQRPVYSLDEIMVTPANNVDVFTVPLDWAETANLVQGQINIIPIGIALNGTAFGGGVVSGTGAGAAAFLAILGNQSWIPAFWRIRYTVGYPDAMVPRYINDLVGCIAAIKILSELGATHAQVTSSSLGIDGLSQSVGTPGPNIYEPRIAKLEEQHKKYVKVVKKLCGLVMFSGNV
jgi:hypothetical protein